MGGKEIETAIGGNAHLPDTERPSEHVRAPGLPPDEIDMMDEKAFAGGRPDAIERPYDPGGLGEVGDQPERARAARPEGYDPARDGPPHRIAGRPATPNFKRDREAAEGAGAAPEPAPGDAGPARGTTGFGGRSGNSSEPV